MSGEIVIEIFEKKSRGLRRIEPRQSHAVSAARVTNVAAEKQATDQWRQRPQPLERGKVSADDSRSPVEVAEQAARQALRHLGPELDHEIKRLIAGGPGRQQLPVERLDPLVDDRP